MAIWGGCVAAVANQDDLLAAGVCILYEGHQPCFIMVQALYEAYQKLRDGDAAALRNSAASSEVRRLALAEMNTLLSSESSLADLAQGPCCCLRGFQNACE